MEPKPELRLITEESPEQKPNRSRKRLLAFFQELAPQSPAIVFLSLLFVILLSVGLIPTIEIREERLLEDFDEEDEDNAPLWIKSYHIEYERVPVLFWVKPIYFVFVWLVIAKALEHFS